MAQNDNKAHQTCLRFVFNPIQVRLVFHVLRPVEEGSEPATLKFFTLDINNRNQTLEDVGYTLKNLSDEKRPQFLLTSADICMEHFILP